MNYLGLEIRQPVSQAECSIQGATEAFTYPALYCNIVSSNAPPCQMSQQVDRRTMPPTPAAADAPHITLSLITCCSCTG
jgi:predicted ATPase with chaperone activity